MPNRFLKDSICTSPTIDRLSAEAEVLWYRLLVQCDDFGRYDARPCVIRARCFPLRLDRITDYDVTEWLGELADAGLLWLYAADDHDCLQVTKWSKHQQKRAIKSKFPDPLEDAPACNQVLASDNKCEHMSSYPNPNPYPSSNANQLHGENELEIAAEPGAIAPVVVTEKRRRKPPDRTREETQLMGVFCEVTGLHLPHLQKDINWWFSELRGIQGFVEGNQEQAVRLVRETVRDMQRRKEPLTITSPKSIIGIANSLAATNGRGVQL